MQQFMIPIRNFREFNEEMNFWFHTFGPIQKVCRIGVLIAVFIFSLYFVSDFLSDLLF
jgi:hypothetical protein